MKRSNVVANDEGSVTVNEKRGDVVLGSHLVRCHHDTHFDRKGDLRLVPSPLLAGSGELTQWTKRESKPGGWRREVEMTLDTDASDRGRSASRFEVVSVRKVPLSHPGHNDRDAGFGGGIQVVVKRLDGGGERIRYTRACGFLTDVYEPATLVATPGTTGVKR